MASKSSIEWTGHTWNPVAGCTVLTPGCTNCYAMKMAARLAAMGQELYAGLTKPSKAGAVWTGVLREAPEHVLLAPLKRKKPTTYFVNSMSDLFHEGVADTTIDKVFAVMALCPQHTFQVLTKRAERMWTYLGADQAARLRSIAIAMHQIRELHPLLKWPFKNIWLGVSCERQQEADERIPHLLSTPAAIRFVSAEPLLAPIDLQQWLSPARGCANCGDGQQDGKCCDEPLIVDNDALDWIIVGGESGRGARPFNIEWADSIVEQCKAADVACFVKQLGSHPFEQFAPGCDHFLSLKSKKGGDPAEWPEYLRIRQFPEPPK